MIWVCNFTGDLVTLIAVPGLETVGLEVLGLVVHLPLG